MRIRIDDANQNFVKLTQINQTVEILKGDVKLSVFHNA
jgi:hypothetical protein